MGKGVIVSEQGEGEYVIKVTYDLKRALIRKRNCFSISQRKERERSPARALSSGS